MTAPPSGAPSTCQRHPIRSLREARRPACLSHNRRMTTVGMHGAGHMGAGLGWALREGGARVVTTLVGRSTRTRKMVADAGLEPLDSLDAVVAVADVVLVVVPPGEARAAATTLAE